MNRGRQSKVLPSVRLAGLILLLLSAGCSTNRPHPSPVVQAAEAAGRKGIEAEAAGKPQAALTAFNRALNSYLAIEDNHGVALTLVNLARIERRLGELTSADAHLDRALGLVPGAPSLTMEIAFEKALLRIARQQPGEALVWAQRSLVAAAREQRGRAHNLVGRILLLQGERSKAREEARQALAELSELDLAEGANGHRLLGEIALAEGEADTAAAEFNQALTLDKKAGLSPRIAGDLRGLSRAATLRQAPREARDYLQRAFTVASAGSEYQSALELLGELADLYRAGGDIATARRLEDERQRLLHLVGRSGEPAAAKP